jgi:two-component system heavy metal sensor histidine kinase CusS
LALLIGNSVEHHFEEQDMEVLTGKLELTRHALEKVHSQSDLDALRSNWMTRWWDITVWRSWWWRHRGRPVRHQRRRVSASLAGTNFQIHPARVRSSGNPRDGVPLRGISEMVQTGIKGEKPAVVAVATDITHHEHFMSSFRFTLWSVVVLAALITGLLGWMAARRRAGALACDQARGGCHYGGSAAFTIANRMRSRSSWWIWPIP